ncbi:MAG: GTP-binding protein [Candidatus Aenigmarchaeota archaeon]|nr:GTP-binding protein [Candidatus Aenigmarchaeota archaeon]
MKKILLVGNPNVGKTSIFSRLTGVDVMISNYPGTTVEFKEGKTKLGEEVVEVMDVPGTYTLEASSKAEKVAAEMIKEGDIVINVLDSTNLERNLNLTFQLLKKNVPMVVALNFWDETRHQGIKIDVEKLEKLLGVPVIPTVGASGEGIKKLVSSLSKAKAHSYKYNQKERWNKICETVNEVQKTTGKDHTFFEYFEDLSIRPLTGIPIAIIIMLLTFATVIFIGEFIINNFFEILFELYRPLITSFGNSLGGGFIHDILIGKLINGQIDYTQSLGLLTTGLYVPIAMVLPYVFAFYLVLGVLEDSGYLPRLATLSDNLMHKIGMHGLAIVPMLLGLGCNVPGALSTRILETKRQQFIALTLMAITLPCMGQIAMIFSLLGPYGLGSILIVFGILLVVWFSMGLLMNSLIPGLTPETFMEIPPYRLPYFRSLIKKLWMRIKAFFLEAIPFVFLGILFINILYVSGIIGFVGEIASPIIVNLLGLPKETVASLIVGFIRKDMAVGMLLPLNLTVKQLIISSVILTMYFPCIATFVVLLKELGIKDMIKSTLIMLLVTLFVGGFLNFILK